jgi:hypothetical protein
LESIIGNIVQCRLPFALILATTIGACHTSSRSEGGAPPISNAELKWLFDEDQAARSGPIEGVDMDALAREDSSHRVRIREFDSSDAPARWLVAAAWDRFQMSRGVPQWFGTQTTRQGGVGRVLLYSLDTTQVTNAERVHRGVETLAALRARLDTINRRLGFP